MSGVFGVVDPKLSIDVGSLTAKMATAMSHQAWYVNESYVDDLSGLAIGRTGIGIFNTKSQPVWNSARTIALVMAGEFFYKEKASGETSFDSDELYALGLYEKLGDAFINQLNGAFIIVIWDNVRKLLLIANDRFGLYPLYYTHHAGRLTFASEVKGILCDVSFPRKLDYTALAQFMRFQRLLGEHTFFEGIHLLPYGSLLRFDQTNSTLNVSHYWDFDQIPAWPAAATFEDAVEETGRLLRQSVEARIEGDHRFGVYLSGGLDSRTLLGLASQNRSPLPSITYGVPNCRDAIYAERIARRVKSPNCFIPLMDGDWVRDEVDFHLELTEGFQTWTHCHSAPTLLPARDLIDVNLTGFGGDQVIGARANSFAPLLRLSPDELAFDCSIFLYINQRYSWPSITEAEEQCLYTPDIHTQVAGKAWASLREELEGFREFNYAQQNDYFTTIYQGTRLSHLNTVYQRAFFEARHPFCDYALVDLVYSMPIDYRLDDKLYLAVINREIPEVTWIPRESNEQLLVDREWVKRTHWLFQKMGRRITRQPVPIIHEDPAGWLRNDLRDWTKALLFDSRTMDRGIFNPDFLRSIFDRHMNGNEAHYTVGKIAPIMTYEMMLRRYYD
jgi:asparagine synthase (glutamine-hydrolysing)